MIKWLKKLAPNLNLLVVVALLVGLLSVFVPAPQPVHAATWWNELWSHRVKITFNHSTVATNMTNFPVGVHLDTGISGFSWADVQDDGDDVRFVDSDDTTPLDYEIELWDDGNDAWLWVQVPQVDGGSATDFIYMYYSNAGASSGEDSEAVWDANYTAVYHFSEASGTIYDSTSYANNSTAIGTNVTYSETGGFGNSVMIGGTAQGYVDLSDSTDLEFSANDAFSIESYVNLQSVPGSIAIFSKHNDAAVQNEYWFGVETDNSFGTLLDDDGSGWATTTSTRQSGVGGGVLSDNTWYGLATTVSATTIYEWVDGAAANPNPSYAYSSGIFAGNATAVIGSNAAHQSPLSGTADELRISKIQRTADWVLASYLSITEASQSYAAAEGASAVSVSTGVTTFGTTTAMMSGTLNGIGGETTVYCYFQWGTSVSLGTNTTEQAKGTTGTFTQGLTGLAEGETYYGRAAARYNTNEYVYGSTLSFTTGSGSWLGTYTFRQEITVAKTTTKTDYPVELTIYKGVGTTNDEEIYLDNGAQSWPGIIPNDLRFTDDDGVTEIPYYIREGSSSSTQAVVDVSIPEISAAPSSFYIYYGRAGDTTTSSIENTFTFGTDFEDYSTGTLIGQDSWAEFRTGHSGSILVEDVSGDRGATALYGGNAQQAVATNSTEGYSVLAWVKRTGGDQALWIDFKDSVVAAYPNEGQGGYNFAYAAYTNAYHRMSVGSGGTGTWLTAQVSGSMATNTFYLLDNQWYDTTVLKGLVNGVEKLDATDATYSTRTHLGLATGQNAGNEFFFSWVAVRQYDAETITYGGGVPVGTGVPIMTTGSYTGISETSVTLWGTLVSTNTTVTQRGFDYGGFYEESNIVIMPDLQGMIDNPAWYYYLENDIDWIIANKDSSNIEAVLFVGDLTNYGYQGPTSQKALDEWGRVDSLLDDLDTAGIIYGVVPGNHDYEFVAPPAGYPDVSDRVLDMYNDYVGPARFASDAWWQGDDTGNSVITFDMGGVPFMAIGLQFGPTNADLAWAESVINSNPDKLFVIYTHAYLDDDNTRLGPTDAHSSSYYFSDGSDNNGEEMWTELISKHSNIVMVVSGHVTTGDGQGRRVDYVGGEPIEQILQNYQMYGEGGKGYFRRYNLQAEASLVYAYTYSVDEGSLSTDPHQFQFAFRADGSQYQSFAFSATEASTSYPVGTYSLPISGLNPSVTYSWRAKALNTEGWGYGTTKTFQTAGAPTVPGAPSFSTSSTSTQIDASWVKGSSSVNTLVRYSTSSYPTTVNSGTQLYFGPGTSASLSIATPGLTYYFSAWGESGGVYSTTYSTASAALGTTSGGLPNPSIFQVENVKVFKDYITDGDLLFVTSIKIIMDSIPAEDVGACVKLQLLDGTTLRAQGAPSQWGYRPASLYLAPGHGLSWGAEYAIALEGREGKWASAPSSTFELSTGSWSGSDLDYLADWILNSAERMGDYYSIALETYSAAKGRVLTLEGGEWFTNAIPGLYNTLPELFSTGVTEIETYTPGIVSYEGAETPEDAWGDYYAGIFDDLGDSVGVSGETAGSAIWMLFIFLAAGLVGVLVNPALGLILCIPLVGTGVYLRLLDMTTVTVIGLLIFVLAMFVYFIKGRV